MNIPFTKAHGAQNDFLFSWVDDLPLVESLNLLALSICHRNTGIGADGWYLVSPGEEGCDIRVRLFNADGGETEMSGNGTRCAAAWALANGKAKGPEVKILTGSGPKTVTLLKRDGERFLFRMAMGLPQVVEDELESSIDLKTGKRDCSIVWVGNPQCVLFVHDFNFDWQSMGAEIETHPRFPQRTNVSFVKVIDQHNIDVRFFERGVGVTNSSGTGSTGAMVASVLRGLAQSPVSVHTPAGILHLLWEDTIYLTGPAELTATGQFVFREQ
ncbi:diaminopimelate epimerase [Bryobacter aggregatus]|uniref:diaminopimelate epimerase n=1 Tax=Bryobacter aggregatus TaxID=360054 RepID=UPI0004E18A85|nr:diaminopimelate epimerase [Bryobacter aggregatus]